MRLAGGLEGAGDPARQVDRDDVLPGLEQRLPDGEEVADRGLGGGRQFGVGAQALVEGVEAVHLELAHGLAAPADVQADLVDALLVGERPRQVVGAVGDDRDRSAWSERVARLAQPVQARARRLELSVSSACASSPDSYISVTMSQPPISSPSTNSCGIVGQLEIADSSWRMRGSGRMSTAAKGVSSACSIATVRAEKPHAGASGVPFMNRITRCSAIASAIASRIGLLCCGAGRGRRGAGRAGVAGRGPSGRGRTGWLDMAGSWLSGGCGLRWGLRLQRQGVDRAADLRAEDAVDEAVLLDAAAAPRTPRRDGRAEVVAAAGVVLDLGVGARGFAASMRCCSPLRQGTLALALEDRGRPAGSGSPGHRYTLEVLADNPSAEPMITITDKGAEKVHEFLDSQQADMSRRRPAGRRARRGLLGLPVPARLRRAARQRRGLREPRPEAARRRGQPASSCAARRSTTRRASRAPASRSNNPNVVAACGCGSSFRVAEEEQVSAI